MFVPLPYLFFQVTLACNTARLCEEFCTEKKVAGKYAAHVVAAFMTAQQQVPSARSPLCSFSNPLAILQLSF